MVSIKCPKEWETAARLFVSVKSYTHFHVGLGSSEVSQVCLSASAAVILREGSYCSRASNKSKPELERARVEYHA